MYLAAMSQVSLDNTPAGGILSGYSGSVRYADGTTRLEWWGSDNGINFQWHLADKEKEQVVVFARSGCFLTGSTIGALYRTHLNILT